MEQYHILDKQKVQQRIYYSIEFDCRTTHTLLYWVINLCFFNFNLQTNLQKYCYQIQISQCFSFHLTLRFICFIIPLYFNIDMDQRISDSKHLPHHFDFHRQQETLQILKNCMEHISHIFKLCHCITKPVDESFGILQYSSIIQKLLKKLIGLIPKHLVSFETHNKLMKQFDQVNQHYQSILKEQRDYKCELNVLETKLAQLQKKEEMIDIKSRQLSYTHQFEKSLNEARKHSERIQKSRLINEIRNLQTRADEPLKKRKISLPYIRYSSSESKISPKKKRKSEFPSEQQKIKRLIEHLKKKV